MAKYKQGRGGEKNEYEAMVEADDLFTREAEEATRQGGGEAMSEANREAITRRVFRFSGGLLERSNAPAVCPALRPALLLVPPLLALPQDGTTPPSAPPSSPC